MIRKPYAEYFIFTLWPFIIFCTILLSGCAGTSSLQQFQKREPAPVEKNARITDFTFNGYTTHWQDHYTRQVRYSNLIRFDVPDIAKTILQTKIDIAEDIGLPGLQMQEGFLHTLLRHTYKTLDDPVISSLEEALRDDHVLVYTDPESETGRRLNTLWSGSVFPTSVPGYQYDEPGLPKVKAWLLENGDRKLWVVSIADNEDREKMKLLIKNAGRVMDQYDLHKGWFGVQTLLKSVTATPGHPVEVIGKGMNEGCSWFVFDGYMEFLAREEIPKWVAQARLPVVTDAGFSPVYGCDNFDGLQVQTMFTPEKWLDYAQDHGCYIFRQVYDAHADSMNLVYDGYIATPGNKEQIDAEDKPFVLRTGNLLSGTIPSMVLFLEKGLQLDRETMWEAILDRRAVGVAEKGMMMGPESFRKALGMLALDRIFLEDYFHDEIILNAKMDGYNLNLNIKNTTTETADGELDLTLPAGLTAASAGPGSIRIPAGQETHLDIPLRPDLAAMGQSNPIGIIFQWSDDQKTTAALLDLPPVITAAPVVYGQPSGMTYPVTIHNYTSSTSYPVIVEVFHEDNISEPVATFTKPGTATTGTFQSLEFDLKLDPGDYIIRTTALGASHEAQLGIRNDTGKPTLQRRDLNQDGVDEFILENDSVRVTLLTTGARVIDYTVKSRQDNVLFKLWPEKPIDDRRPFRKQGFYPFGGFEDFLGQPSIETHKVYDAEVLPGSPNRASVRMKAHYYGGTIEKTFTLYGNSPLLEVRFAVSMNRPELNVLGPQPIVELGRVHGPEDVFIIPEKEGNKEYRMMPERYYGRIAYLREGWNAGWDPEEDVAFTGAYPVDLPLFLHMWMNHPSNRDAHHYYAEFQPWIPIPRHSTLHFNYYLYGQGGSWESSLEALRSKNLIEKTKNN